MTPNSTAPSRSGSLTEREGLFEASASGGLRSYSGSILVRPLRALLALTLVGWYQTTQREALRGTRRVTARKQRCQAAHNRLF